jgi:hypothetical protein
VEKYSRAGQSTDDIMAHAHCMLDTEGNKYTLRLCNTHCFSTATMVARMRLSVTIYVHCLSFSSRCGDTVVDIVRLVCSGICMCCLSNCSNSTDTDTAIR